MSSSKRHEFIGVHGHPDDDECTYRSDGTEASYCGEEEAAAIHQTSGGLCDYDSRRLMCTRSYGHDGDCILVPETPQAVAGGWAGDDDWTAHDERASDG